MNLEKNEEAHVVAGETEGSPVKTPVACEQPTGLKLDKDSEVGSDLFWYQRLKKNINL